MSSASYLITDEAIDDLDEIDDFIARRMGNPANAEVVRLYLKDAFERIGEAPARCGGKTWPHVTDLPVKFLTVRKFVLIYDDRVNPVRIIGIAGGRQDFERLLGSDPRYREFGDD